MKSQQTLKGKVAMITGSSSGIGKAIAAKLHEEGAYVAIIASADLTKAQAVVDEIDSTGARAHPFTCNVSDLASIKITVDAIVKKFGTIDILVNAAGVFFPTKLGETSVADFDLMVNTNLKSVYFVTDTVAPILKKKDAGKIVNVASISAYVGSKDYGLYCGVKSAVVALTKTFALQLAPHNVNVNAVAPGNTATPINEDIRTKPEFAERRAMIEATTPSRRKFSDPEDIANAVYFLATDSSRAMHGSTILLDEGRAAGI